MAAVSDSQQERVPEHVAIIMDGNGRWAKARGQNRLFGHKQGVISVLKTIEAAADAGVKYLTLYTFSTENWNRPEQEVSGLMDLLVSSIKFYTPDMMKKGVKLKFIGERNSLSESVQQSMAEIESQTAENKVITVMPAVNYGSRLEIVDAFKSIAGKVKEGTLSPDDISEELISQSLYTAGIPDPDLLIRTSGEMRLSNFLLWQLSYSEFYITDVYWPDFTKEEFSKAVEAYQNRSRRFGGV
ncbi:MAG: isoprenyl transferase [Lentisphaeraceae bacterium]|nr:isoprenyl transferase [Lentisphaeraceae bacterium]